MLISSDYLFLVKDVGKVAFTAVLSVGHGSHEDTSTTLDDMLVEVSMIGMTGAYSLSWAFTSKTLDFALTVHLVEFEDG